MLGDGYWIIVPITLFILTFIVKFITAKEDRYARACFSAIIITMFSVMPLVLTSAFTMKTTPHYAVLSTDKSKVVVHTYETIDDTPFSRFFGTNGDKIKEDIKIEGAS